MASSRSQSCERDEGVSCSGDEADEGVVRAVGVCAELGGVSGCGGWALCGGVATDGGGLEAEGGAAPRVKKLLMEVCLRLDMARGKTGQERAEPAHLTRDWSDHW